jgi:hypothetical protein
MKIYNTYCICTIIFGFNMIWQRQSMTELNFCRRLAESDITVMPSATCMDWLCWCYNHAAHAVSSSKALAFLFNMSESPTAIKVKNQRKTFSAEEKLDVISWPEQGERIVDVCHNVRLAYHSICTIRDNADWIKEVLSQELKSVCLPTILQPYRNKA